MDYNFGELLKSLNSGNHDFRVTALRTCLQVAISKNQAHYSAQFADILARIEISESFYEVAPTLFMKDTDKQFHRAASILIEMNGLLAMKTN